LRGKGNGLGTGSDSDSGSGDFFSLSLVAGYIQFKYDLGSGLANITSRRYFFLLYRLMINFTFVYV
jgi:hypothetical protein